jgi:hypothetical protein
LASLPQPLVPSNCKTIFWCWRIKLLTPHKVINCLLDSGMCLYCYSGIQDIHLSNFVYINKIFISIILLVYYLNKCPVHCPDTFLLPQKLHLEVTTKLRKKSHVETKAQLESLALKRSKQYWTLKCILPFFLRS